MNDISELVTRLQSDIAQTQTLEQLDALRVQVLGKNGTLTAQLKHIGKLPASQRRQAGVHVNKARDTLQEAIQQRKCMLENACLDAAFAKERVDITLPGRRSEYGSLHPVSLTLERIIGIFAGMGFDVIDGPEVEDDWHNFEALNFPLHHPARAMHDTFYLSDPGYLLRTHTSGVQVRFMEKNPPPIRMVTAGKVYRADSDQTHSPMFHQMEGLLVDTKATFADLKATLHAFVHAFFGCEIPMRFRPSYFPFTEPSAEVDILWERVNKRPAWLEVLGCGMVHPAVLKNVGIDPERYSGFAFGLGVERLAMLRYGLADLRAFFENDCRFLRQFYA